VKVLLIAPSWKNSWIDGFRKACGNKLHHFMHLDPNSPTRLAWEPDLVIYGWADQHVRPEQYLNAVKLVFMRRYEFYMQYWKQYDWRQIDGLICVNDWITNQMRGRLFERGIRVPIQTIYNSVDPELWKYKDRKHTGTVGMACHVHPKKNLPLAMQVLESLPAEYSLHIAGAIQDECTAEYLDTIGKAMRRKVVLYGDIPRSDLDFWWELHGHCLSTSISEGNPNNVNEAMMKGICPVVHRWPGAFKQYPAECLFNTPAEAANIILGPIKSQSYLTHALQNFGLDNLNQVLKHGAGLVETRKKLSQNDCVSGPTG